ncbi:MAG: aa3-type cytochrome c oxidase subunit IV [Rhizobiales bacterium]|nr:aa3-type cytochrome c oxidase subunit IV [Hyphomicrobiales bacterium]
MAEHGELEYAAAEGNDLPAHEASYANFVHFVYVGLLYAINIVIGLGVGGVNGAWWIAFAVFVIATIAAIFDLVGNTKAASAVALVLALIALAGSA